MSDFDLARQAKALHSKALLTRQHVVGVGVGYKTQRGGETDKLSVVVLVSHKLPPSALSSAALIPKALTGVPTDVIEVGELRALAWSPQAMSDATRPLAGEPRAGSAVSLWTGRQRPAAGGASIGHYQVTAGTLGCVVHDRASGRRLILSNNHVLANCNAARRGDPILQPGPADGGMVGPDTLASLERFIPLRFGLEPPVCRIAEGAARLANAVAHLSGSRHRLQAVQMRPTAVNYVDAAVARALDDDDLLERALEIGAINGYQSAHLGMGVCKAGRTTALTTGSVRVMDASVQIGYTEERVALFEGQVVTTPMSQGGDSGSLMVALEGRHAVGLLFAGSAQATIFNPIAAVLEALKIDLPGTPDRPAKGLDGAGEVRDVQAVRAARQAELMKKANVVGVGVGRKHGQPALVVMVTHKAPLESLSPADRIPGQIDGIPVQVQEVGTISLAGS